MPVPWCCAAGTAPARAWTRSTARAAPFRPNPAGDVLFLALAADQARTADFLGVLTGTVDPRRFFSPANLVRVLGVRGMLAAARAGKTRGPRQ
jgi:hypothetical protein